MKSNIDLTSNQIFSSTQTQHAIRLFRIQMQEIVKTGDRRDRFIKAIEDRFEVGGFCDRCGRELTKTPWSNCVGICRNCEIELGVSKRRKAYSLDIDTNMLPDRRKLAAIKRRR